EGTYWGCRPWRGPGQHAQNLPPLAVAERLLAMTREDLGDGTARRLLDLAIGIDEGQVEAGREAPADAALAGAHQSHQRDRAIARNVVHRSHGCDIRSRGRRR